MPTTHSLASAAAAALAALTVTGSALAADSGTGGFSVPERPRIKTLACAADAGQCSRGEVLEVRGEHLDQVRTVVFLGRSGARDDRRAKPLETSDAELSVAVPAGARSGPVRAVASDVEPSAPSRVRLRVVAGSTTTKRASVVDTGTGVFPIQGKHDMGQSATNGFGGGRGHQGQDMFAACGTPLVAVKSGRVQRVATQAAAGNYVVLQDDAGMSYAYMHMAAPSPLRAGQRIEAGAPVGSVGESGRATGCHLHFEIWTAPGWYLGGKPIDPLPQLRTWDAAGHGE